ncbi:response regulator [Candidatus Dojkabacteria bacterium]|nr:response regulator [Candidatus Dojkabacteria bacterium]
MNLLLVEDNKHLGNILSEVLSDQGYRLDWVCDGEEGIKIAKENKGKYDCIILDIMLPKKNGYEVCTEIRNNSDFTKILMLSALRKDEEKINGLHKGADDYLTKPFEMPELLARIKALSRRSQKYHDGKLQIGKITLDSLEQKVREDNQIIKLTNLEFRLLRLLMEKKGKFVSKTEILERVWDKSGEEIFSNSISVHISRLRKKLKSINIASKRLVGYRIEV